MKKALTDQTVKHLKPPATGQVDYFDKGYPGFALRMSLGGRMTWVAYLRVPDGNGKTKLKRQTLGHYPAMSLAEAREAWRDAHNGKLPVAGLPRPAGVTFEAAFEEWLKRDQDGKRSCDEARRLITKDILPAWKHRALADITRSDVNAALDAVVDRGSPTTANRIHTRLTRMFKWHVGRGHITASPMNEDKPGGKETTRDRVLTDAELAEVWHALNGGPFASAARMLILTGARREEMGALRWSEIDGDTITIPAERYKTKKRIIIPLSGIAREILDNMPRIEDCDYVFTTNGRSPIRDWAAFKKRLPKLTKGWTYHDLRRTAATGMQKLGVALAVTEAVLGHTGKTRAGVAGIYHRHDYADEKRAALARWADHVTKIAA